MGQSVLGYQTGHTQQKETMATYQEYVAYVAGYSIHHRLPNSTADASIPDTLNDFYSQFEAQNIPAGKATPTPID